MPFDFDEIVDRRGTDSLKFDFAAERGRPADVLPLWVADMDFRAPKEVLDALRGAVDHGIFGYTDTKRDYYEAAAGWFSARFGWTPEEDWLVKSPGMMFSIAMAVRALTKPGDAVLIQTPVYYPFLEAVRNNGRRLVKNELVLDRGRYRIDFDDFGRKVRDEKVRLFILCSPHNPVGRVWTEDELKRLGGICEAYGVYVFSDEIHCDFTYAGHTHRMFPEVNPSLSPLTVLGTAPSKTFNLAGLQAANIWIPGKAVRDAYRRETAASGYSQLNALGLAACRAAYLHGAPWLEALKIYLAENLSFLRAFFRERLPELTLIEPEGTYLVWFDCAGLGLDKYGLERFFREDAKLWLDRGPMFGGEADLFQRLNIACPRPFLEKALLQLEEAVKRAGIRG